MAKVPEIFKGLLFCEVKEGCVGEVFGALGDGAGGAREVGDGGDVRGGDRAGYGGCGGERHWTGGPGTGR